MRNLPYNRADRVGQLIYQLIAAHIHNDMDDDRLAGIQITSVQMTKDLSIARVYFYVAGGEKKQKICKEALEDMDLRRYVAQGVKLKAVPMLEFRVDEGIENSEKIEELLKGLKQEA